MRVGPRGEMSALMRIGGDQSLLSLPREDIARRLPSGNEEMGCHQTPKLPASHPGCPASRM